MTTLTCSEGTPLEPRLGHQEVGAIFRNATYVGRGQTKSCNKRKRSQNWYQGRGQPTGQTPGPVHVPIPTASLATLG